MPEVIPCKGKKISNFVKAGEIASQDQGKHKISFITKKKKATSSADAAGQSSKNPPLYYYKRFTDEEKPFAPWEAAWGMVYQMTLGDRAPKVRAIYDKNGNILGTISKAFPDFLPLKDDKRTTDEYVENGLIEIIWEKRMWQDDDGHSKNIGSVSTQTPDGRKVPGKFVNIDHDNSGYPQIVGIKGERKIPGTNQLVPGLPADYDKAFALRAIDIELFPRLNREEAEKYDVPYYDVGIYRAEKSWTDPKAYTEKQVRTFLLLQKHPKTQDKLFRQALKDLLIPPNNFHEVATANIRDSEMKQRFLTATIERQNELAVVLLQIPGFRIFLRNNRNLLAEIQEDFNSFSATIKQENLKISSSAVESRFNFLWLKAHENGIVWGLHGISSFAQQIKRTHPRETDQILNLYNQILDNTLDFYNKENPPIADFVNASEEIISSYQHVFVADSSLADKWKEIKDRLLAPLLSLKDIEACHQSMTSDPTRDSSYIPPDYIYEQYDGLDRFDPTTMTGLIRTFSEAFHNWLLDKEHQTVIINTIESEIKKYLPPDSGIMSRSWHWKYWTRNRAEDAMKLKEHYPKYLKNHPELIKLILESIESKDVKLREQDWKSTTSFTTSLTSSLYQQFVKDFKKKSLLKQLKDNHELCIFYDYIIRGVCNTEIGMQSKTLPTLREIFNNLKELTNNNSKEKKLRLAF